MQNILFVKLIFIIFYKQVDVEEGYIKLKLVKKLLNRKNTSLEKPILE